MPSMSKPKRGLKPSEKNPRKAPKKPMVTVRAKAGMTVPVVLGGKRVVRLTGEATVTIPISSFSRRRISAGDLVDVNAKTKTPKKKKTDKLTPDTSFKTSSAGKGDS